MSHPSIQEAHTLLGILNTFYNVSGASVNLEKSLIFFFNTPPTTQSNISKTLGFSTFSPPSNYLVTPLISSSLKHSTWQEIIHNWTKNISSCTFQTLSLVGRLVLIKVILQSMSLYLLFFLVTPK